DGYSVVSPYFMLTTHNAESEGDEALLPVSGSDARRIFTHFDRGSASTSSALSSSVAGSASSAPSQPSTHTQNSREKNEISGVTPTDSPVNFGWMMAWMTKLSTL